MKQNANACRKAVCLLSGGMDSATALYVAHRDGFRAYALSFLYGQRHAREMECARWLAEHLGLEHREMDITLPWKGSALLDPALSLPMDRSEEGMAQDIPSTYVPARNTIFLAFALSWAEVLDADVVYIGANALDYSGYPDCRPEYFQAMEEVFARGTKRGVEGRAIRIETPLLHKNKAEIAAWARELGVPLEHTWSCYRGDAVPCGRCDACVLREKGFREAGLTDPLIAHSAQ
jgi:7-cyano-7-deazaguanine synthase